MPKIKDMLSTHPLLGALPHELREPLESSTKNVMKLQGVTLYKEGAKPSGIWLISNGVIKVCYFQLAILCFYRERKLMFF